MSRVCILTDSTVQFTQPNFPGRECVHILPLDFRPAPWRNNSSLFQGKSGQWLEPPKVQDFVKTYDSLGREYDTILVLLLSSAFGSAVQNACLAVTQSGNHATIEVIDSQVTAAALGLLVQNAAEALSSGATFREVIRGVRDAIPRLYMMLCIPQLHYLMQMGGLEYSQALAGELLGIMPVFTLEEGQLMLMEKVRTPRHLFELFQEFMGEFESLAHIALVYDRNQPMFRSRLLSQYIQETFPGVPFSEHFLNPALASLFGPQSTILILLER